MSDITLITPPDKIQNNEYTILLICPSNLIKDKFQDCVVNFNKHINVFLYEAKDDDHPWLMDIFGIADLVIFDIDNSDPQVRSLASYFVSKSKTYWLTNSGDSLYNLISYNRIFDLDFINEKLGGH